MKICPWTFQEICMSGALLPYSLPYRFCSRLIWIYIKWLTAIRSFSSLIYTAPSFYLSLCLHKVHNECSHVNQQPQQQSYNRRASVSSRLEIGSPPEIHHSMIGATLRCEPAPTAPTGENGGTFLSPPNQRSDVIVKLTAASEDSNLNM